jgi:hypothetical protein
MRQPRLLLCLSLASAAAPATSAQVLLHGTVTTERGEHPALFSLSCTTGAGGALSLQLAVLRDSAPVFPFDAFEGPGAPASRLPSAALQAGKQGYASLAVAGRISGDDPDMFVFGIAAAPGKRNTVTDSSPRSANRASPFVGRKTATTCRHRHWRRSSARTRCRAAR